MNDRDPDYADEAQSLDDLDLFQEERPEEDPEIPQDATDALEEDSGDPRRARSGGSFGALWFGVGVAVAAAGAGLASWSAISPAAAAPVMEAIGRVGLAPVHVLLMGLLICGFCGVQSHVDRRLHSLEEENERNDAELREMVAWLVEAQEARDPTSQGPALEIATFLQTHEDKINNLTRALKLYGKPLVEITNKMTDTHRQLGDLQRAVAGVQQSLEVTAESLRETVREELQGASGEDAVVESELREVLEAAKASQQALEELGDSLAEQLRDALARQLEELKSAAPVRAAQETPPSVDEAPSPLEQSTPKPRSTDRDSFLGAVAKLKQLRS